MTAATAPEPLEPPLIPPDRPPGAGRSLVADIAANHGASLLRLAKRHSANADDAHDAYQRSMEILLRHADRIDPGRAVPWLTTVIRREAWAVAAGHGATVPLDDDEADDRTGVRHHTTDDEHLHRIDLAQRAGEALATLKETEAHALCLRAQGLSYDEIATECGWTYTKVNRVVTEGRRAFVAHFTAVEHGRACEEVAGRLAAFVDGELTAREAIRVRAHLVRCAGCRHEMHAVRRGDLALRVLVGPVAASAGGGGVLLDHVLAPLGHLAGRVQPALDPVLGTKVGAVAVSAAAIAGGTVAVDRAETDRPPPAKLSPALAAAPARPAPGSPVPIAAQPVTATLDAAVDSTSAIERRAQQRRAAERRRAARRRRTAERRRAQQAANRGEFSAAAAEFPGSAPAAPSTTSAGRAATGDAPGEATAATPALPATDPAPVELDGSAGAPSVDVITDLP